MGVFSIMIWGGAASLAASAGPVDYLRDVKPIFAERCTSCHGGLRQKSGLRLDTGSAALKGGKRGAAVTAGDGANSLLIRAVTGAAGFRMPPEEDGAPLSAEQIDVLKRWIDEGALSPADEQADADPRSHWAYQKPERGMVPAVSDPSWVRNPVDAFVAAGHEREGLRRSEPAEKAVLLRRVYLDLIGLPPTVDEVQAFLADGSAGAYERVVDRLLSSPRYGERWGRHWMDVWRYSDWYGRRQQNNQRNSRRNIWRWRDWIIASLNDDKGYDRMVVEMLAGDEAAPGDEDVHRATGYLGRNWYVFNRNVWLQDTIEHVGVGFLGMSLKCARCHDHKYDPIAQEDYYKFRAFFEPHDVRVDRAPGQPETMQVGNKAGTGKITILKAGYDRVFDADSKAATYVFARGNEKSPVKDRAISAGVPAVFGDDGLAISPIALPRGVYYPALRAFVEAEDLGALRAAVDKATAAVKQAGKDAAKKRLADVTLAAARARLKATQARYAAEKAKYPTVGEGPPTDRFEDLAVIALQAERMAAVCAAREAEVRAEEALTTARAAVTAADEAIAKTGEDKTADEAAKKKTADAKAAAVKKVAAAEKTLTGARTRLETAEVALGAEGGAYQSIGKVYPKTSSGRRLALARWITSRENPLAARVAVNHIWMRHFGTPLVENVRDFGLRSAAPVHQALLDWLAVEFMESGWRMKHLHRLLVTSNTYMQRSDGVGATAEANRSIDEANRYWWRMNPRRMEAELVRDGLLHLAGRLDETMGGLDLDPATADTLGRRSVYFRHTPNDKALLLEMFDPADPAACYRRSESVVPHQALALANGGMALNNARLIAGSIFEQVADVEESRREAAFVRLAFETVLCRAPGAAELAECNAYLRELTGTLTEANGLKAFEAGEPGQVKPATDPRQRAREGLVHVLFNHHDFVTIW